MAINQQKFQKAVKLLSKYYGIINQKDVASLVGLDNIEGKNVTNNNSANRELKLPSLLDLELNKLLMDDYSGALTIGKLSNKLDEILKNPDFTPENDEEVKIKSGLVKIFKGDEINEILGLSSGQSSNINSSVLTPSKEKPNLSVIKVNSVRVGPEKRYTDASTIFLNGMPTLEMSRATPYLDIEFLFPRPPINENDIVQTMSIPKFLYGAKKADKGSPLHTMVDSLKISATELKSPTQSKSEFYSNIGMEIFTSPQLLVNADTTSANRANPVLNKFAPFLTLKKLDLNVVPSTGIMSYKSGNLTLVLHDRSRLNEIAEFLKPDLYGLTELGIEYGWIHPDGERIAGTDNVYGDFINGIRVKERYAIINSSFTFEDGGLVTINLKIAMKGSTDFELANSTDDTNKLSDSLKELDKLEKMIEEYKNRLFKNSSEEKIKEIRGIQILDAAVDARSYLSLSSDLKKNLSQFKNALKQSNKPDAKELIRCLDDMFGAPTKKAKQNGISVTSDVRNTLQNIVKDKIERLVQNNDPFFPYKELPSTKNKSKRGKISFTEKNKKQSAFKPKFTASIPLGVPVSLAKMLLFFIGEPLVATGKFDDVQFIFHTFNSHAGAMKDANIAEFVIDMAYFTEQYYRLRESTISKSANLNLRQFLNFLSETVLDDYAAPAYGLYDQKGSLFKRKEDGSAEAINEVPVFQERMENILKNYGISDGQFVPGKIQFLIESYPERTGVEDGEDSMSKSARNILKIHVVDQTNNSYETLNKIITAQRDAGLSVFNPGRSDKTTGGEPTPAEESKKIEAARMLAAAEASGFIELIKDNENEIENKIYKIKGGQTALKNFLMQTMPYISYGVAGTTIKTANLSSMQIPELATVNLQRSYQKSDLDPSGEHPGGLPMQIIPTQLTLQTLGMPLINFAQCFYVDFQTGTTADNIYAVVGLNHSFEPGTFTSEIKMSPVDAYGKYINISNRLSEALTLLKDIDTNQNS